MYEPIRPEAGRKLLKANQVCFWGFGIGVWVGSDWLQYHRVCLLLATKPLFVIV